MLAEFFNLFFFISGVMYWGLLITRVLFYYKQSRFPELRVGWERMIERERKL